ncbi:hypothetical protein C2845_PM12G22950 [Panicum miliaceum]|uniref:PB1-like domain-containing protein n=1 Tax=Panicum miliaceum TaxID=4540 RepID=A0A3L6QE67_PANMI|nr:hypothetical protein C2845_PM12G22950 [Panicum miliaceum]
MANQDAILLKVFRGGAFSGSSKKYGSSTDQGGEYRSIPNFDRDYMSYFELCDCLKEFGLKDGDSLYYLKPGYCPPNSLVLIFYDNQCNQLLADHAGLSSCSLFIVPNPERLVITEPDPRTNPTQTAVRSLVDAFRPEEIGGREDDDGIGEDMAQLSTDDDEIAEDETYRNIDLDETDDDLSDVELVPEHDVEKKAVDAGGYLFEGDVGDDELYILKKQQCTTQSKGKNDGTNQDKGKGKVSGKAISRAEKGGTKIKGSQDKRGRKPKDDATSSSQQQSQHNTPITTPQKQGRKIRHGATSSSQQQPQMMSNSQCEVQFCSQPSADPISMNNWFGVGMFHQVDGGPTIDRIRASRERSLKKKK